MRQNTNTLEKVENLWQIYDEGYTTFNDLILATRLLHFINESDTVSVRDKEMYAKVAQFILDGGFLVREEKKFLINYLILLVGESTDYSEQMRDSSSVLDVWPQQQGVRTDYNLGTYRKEALLWFIRMYEVLGNDFLRKRHYSTEYYGLELARMLESEKCKLKEDEYVIVADFLRVAEAFINRDIEVPNDQEQGIKIMRKLIWKIKQGITKYS